MLRSQVIEIREEIRDVERRANENFPTKVAWATAIATMALTAAISVLGPWMLTQTLVRLPLSDQNTKVTADVAKAVAEESKSIAGASKATAESLKETAADAKKSSEDARKVADTANDTVTKLEQSLRTLERRVEQLSLDNQELKSALDRSALRGLSSSNKR